jgi:alcohol dehydrogenase (cytochrome c)
MTYELDGRQYIVSGSGGVMFAWVLPQNSSTTATASAH